MTQRCPPRDLDPCPDAAGPRRRRRDRRRRSKAACAAPTSSAASTAALKQPALHVQLAAVDGDGLAGYIMARRTSGEFGRPQPGLRLEVVGVRGDRRGQGVGKHADGRAGQLRRAPWRGRSAHHGDLDQRRHAAVAAGDATSCWRPTRWWTAPSATVTRPSAATRWTCPPTRAAAARSTTARPRATISSASARCWPTCRRCVPRTCRRSCASTAQITGRDRQDVYRREARRGDGRLGHPRLAHGTARRRHRRLPDGARRPRRLRPHRAGGRARHHRRRSGLRAPRHRPCAGVAAVRQPRRRCTSTASRRWSRPPICRCWASFTAPGSSPRNGWPSCAASDTAAARGEPGASLP